jgi:acyl carrier protein
MNIKREAIMQDFLKQIAAIMEMEAVKETDKLSDLEQLDSLSVLSLISMLDANYGVNLSTADINRMQTVGDLWKHVHCMTKGCA